MDSGGSATQLKHKTDNDYDHICINDSSSGDNSSDDDNTDDSDFDEYGDFDEEENVIIEDIKTSEDFDTINMDNDYDHIIINDSNSDENNSDDDNGGINEYGDFDEEEKAVYDFYATYARRHDFSLRKLNVKRNNGGEIYVRQFICSKEGSRHKMYMSQVDKPTGHRPLSRCYCPARLRVRYDVEISRWKVTSFHDHHNHDMTADAYLHLISAFLRMTDADKAIDNDYDHISINDSSSGDNSSDDDNTDDSDFDEYGDFDEEKKDFDIVNMDNDYDHISINDSGSDDNNRDEDNGDDIGIDEYAGLDDDAMKYDRLGAYNYACFTFTKVAAKKKNYYDEVMDDILKLTIKVGKINVVSNGTKGMHKRMIVICTGDGDSESTKGHQSPMVDAPTHGDEHFSKVMPMSHNFGGVHVYPSYIPVHSLPTVPKVYPRLSNVINLSSCSALLQEFMKKRNKMQAAMLFNWIAGVAC
ncbi:hypothetical protein RIF29_25086 [Crotalaria pallida]|uniref:FAR1 domain-containing protein n=1 Tax=Crotalaria pallida TaxID=3830 RepID=A0AAN9HX60_CROPI